MSISNESTSRFWTSLQACEMPGHVKRGGTGEPDPDPTEYLFITYEEKQKVL